MATRLHRHELLEHPTRDAIFQLIEHEPGIPFLELHDRLKTVPAFSNSLGYGSLSYHLQVMEKFGLLATRKAGRFRRHYAYSSGLNGSTTAVSVLQTPPIPDLVHIVLREPGLSQRAIWQRFAATRRTSRQTVGYHLQRLEALDLVTVVRRGRSKAYHANERLQKLDRFLPTRQAGSTRALALLVLEKEPGQPVALPETS